MASSIMVKRIIIIGATSGIGYEVAKIYWKRGYQLGLAGRWIGWKSFVGKIRNISG
jgi:short-subunit dehydrogenase